MAFPGAFLRVKIGSKTPRVASLFPGYSQRVHTGSNVQKNNEIIGKVFGNKLGTSVSQGARSGCEPCPAMYRIVHGTEFEPF